MEQSTNLSMAESTPDNDASSWADYVGAIILQIVIFTGGAMFVIGQDGLMLQILKYAFFAAFTVICIAGVRLSYNWKASFLTMIIGIELMNLSIVVPAGYQLDNVVTTETMKATHVSVESRGLSTSYRVVADNRIFVLQKDLVTMGQDFTLETRQSDDGRVKRQYLCANARCAHFSVR